MDQKETNELLEYIEFNLLAMCDHMEQYTDPPISGKLYEQAYKLLSNLELTLDTQGQSSQISLNRKH